MIKLLISLITLLLAATASAETFPGTDRSASNTIFLTANFTDSGIVVAAGDQEMMSPCMPFFKPSVAVYTSTYACYVPIGWNWNIKKWTINLITALATTEACKVGISTDITAEPNTWLTWSTTEIGSGTTHTCDVTNADTDVDAADDYCVMSDPIGTTIVSGDAFYILIDEAAVNTCTGLNAINYTIEATAVLATLP